MFAAIRALLARMYSTLRSALRSVVTWVTGRGQVVVGIVALGLGTVGILVGLSLLGEEIETPSIDVVEGEFFQIATGPVTGAYYPLGSAIASVISSPAGSVRCIVEERCGPPGLIGIVQTSAGSVENISAVRSGQMQSAFAQANVVNQAYRPSGPNSASYEGLRAISGLYTEVVHLVVARGSHVEALADLRGHSISIDRPGSGTAGIARQILATAGISARNSDLVEVSADRATDMLIQGEIEAFFFVAGPPVRAVQALANSNAIRLISISGPAIDALIASEPYLGAITLEPEVYSLSAEVVTIGVPALWIVDADADFDLIYRITRALWHKENRVFLESGPTQAQLLNIDDALSGVPVPFHPGASQYYLEVGLFPAQ